MQVSAFVLDVKSINSLTYFIQIMNYDIFRITDKNTMY